MSGYSVFPCAHRLPTCTKDVWPYFFAIMKPPQCWIYYRINLLACSRFSVCLNYLGSSACAHLVHIGSLHVKGNTFRLFSRTRIQAAFHGPQDTRPITSCMWGIVGSLCAQTNMNPIIPSFPMRENSGMQMSPPCAEEQLP